MRMRIKYISGLLCLLLTVSGWADEALLKRPEVKSFIRTMVHEHGFAQKELEEVFTLANFQPQIIQSMEKPFEKKSWDVYKALFLQPERIRAGLTFWKQNRKALEKAEKQFGVPAPMIVAILGVETLYGKHQGNYRVLDALTTLAFDYPKRAPFFRNELKEYLLLCREQEVNPTEYVGSYAGAIGKPQFMPSSYRFYAMDFKGSGKYDLIHNDEDVIASIANYFKKHGWEPNQTVVQQAEILGGGIKQLVTNTKTPNYHLSTIVKAGVKPLHPKHPYAKKVGVIELTTQRGAEYWVAYPNFYVIKHYNASPQYALVVYLLAEELKTLWMSQANATHSYA